MPNPIEDFLKHAKETHVKSHSRRTGGKTVHVDAHDRKTDDEEARVAALRARQAKELAMWNKWQNGGRQQSDLQPLLRSFRPMIRAKVNQYTRGNIRIPHSAIDLNFQIEFVNALMSYDPAKGALGTYVYQYLNKGKRWIAENQNIGRIPENRIYKIQKYKDAIDELTEETSSPPDLPAIAERLGWSEKEVGRMDDELRNDLIRQGFEEDPYSVTPSRTEEVLKLFKYELAGDQRAVYEYLTGYGRPRVKSTSEIAKKMKLKDYQVSRIKSQIENKLKHYIKD